MFSVKNNSEPRFFVLPSLFICCRRRSDEKYHILEPILGEYKIKSFDLIEYEIQSAIKIKNKIYLFKMEETDLGSVGPHPWHFSIFAISNDKINLVKKTIFDQPRCILSWKYTKWPIYYCPADNIASKSSIHILDENLEFKYYGNIIENPNIIISTYPSPRINNYRPNLLTYVDENTYLYLHDTRRIYKAEYEESESYLYFPKKLSSRKSDLFYYNHEEMGSSECVRINKNFMYIGRGNIIDIYRGDEYITDFHLHRKCIISNKIWILGESYRDDEDKSRIFIIRDDDDIKNTKEKSTMNINDIGFIHSEINCSLDHYRCDRIIEDPFKSEERHRLAEWLYNQLGQILPLTIIGLITDFCCLVEYYDYDLLMNYLNRSHDEIA